jgi:hypothetical protein
MLKVKKIDNNEFYVSGLVGFINDDLDGVSHIESEDVQHYIPNELKLGKLKEIHLINKMVTFEVNSVDWLFSIEVLKNAELRRKIKMNNDTFISVYHILGDTNESR